MAFVHGKDIAFNLDDAAGTLRNVKIYLNSVTGLPGGRALSEVTSFGDQGTRNIPGLSTVTFSISGSYDATASTGIATVANGLRTATATATFEYGPEGNATGKPKFTGECWLTELTYDAAVADRVPISATFAVDGVVTQTVY